MTFTIKKKNNTTWYKRSPEMNSRKYTSNVGCFLAFWLSYWLLDIDYCLKLFKLEQIAILFNSCRLVQTFRKILAKSGCLHAYELSTDNYYNVCSCMEISSYSCKQLAPRPSRSLLSSHQICETSESVKCQIHVTLHLLIKIAIKLFKWNFTFYILDYNNLKACNLAYYTFNHI